MPEVKRAAPPYVQITDHYRAQIIEGLLAEGDKLPGVHDVAKEWGVSAATAAKALSQLGVEGLITSSPRGSFVQALNTKASTPQDRIKRARRTGSAFTNDETHRILSAKTVKAPTHVADLFDMDSGGEIIRREWATLEQDHIRSLTVTWHPAGLAADVPELLSTKPSLVGTLLQGIERVTGKVTHGRDYMHARGADAREANYLHIPIGSSTLAVTWLLWAPDGTSGEDQLVEYGEQCLPPRHTMSYPYELPEA